MAINEDLNPKELQNLDEQLRITSRETAIRENMTVMPGAPTGLTDAFLQNIMDFEEKWDAQPAFSVSERVGEHEILEACQLTEEEAENAVIDLLNALAKNNVRIDCPEMVSAKEFYRWLCEDFIKQEVNMPVGNDWNANYIYTELVPEGPDAMNFFVKTFIEDLFRLDFDFNPWTFDPDLLINDKESFRSRFPPAQDRYVNAWRDAISSVAEYRYTPVAGVRIDEKLANFTFDVSCTLVREDGRQDAFNGCGSAKLSYDGDQWNIREIRFPGFALS